MKNLAIGTKVNYFHTSIIDNNTTVKVSEVIGHEFDGRFNYVILENGDKMFKEALSVHKTMKNLAKKLVSKKAGLEYVYEINNTRFVIQEFNECRGWCLNEFVLSHLGNWELIDSYGHDGFLLRECKGSILAQWNINQIN